MVHFSANFSCFVPSDSSRVSDEVSNKSEKPTSKSKSSGAPVVVSYLPMNSSLSPL
ncbi:hypothetical protein NC651_021761 [Populus alba x Populus x berolinensis]|nr:hypothetical protein NC651_021761 [Populus alba x Populus x berolinensis]